MNIDDTIQTALNANKLLEALIIIINNAKDAIVERNIFNPKININVEKIDNEFTISICDNAGGMTQKTMQKIFDENFTTKHNSQGDGIGLHISKKIIQHNLNGTLYVKNIDKGVCFKINLPII
jgi:C4-dicarboxylate-specific signal transduction histidine kinase